MRVDNKKTGRKGLTFDGKDPEGRHGACTSQKRLAGTPVLQELPSECTELGIVAYLQPEVFFLTKYLQKQPATLLTLNNPGKFMVFVEVDKFFVGIERRRSK